MKKFVNVRLPVIIALALCAGIACGLTLYYYRLSVAWLTVAVTPALLIFLIYYIVKHKAVRALVTVLLPLILYIGGGLNGYFALVNYDYSEVEADKFYSISGTVTEKGPTASGEYIIIDLVTVDGNRIDGKTYVYLSPTYGEFCDIGYTVNFWGELEKLTAFPYGKLNYYAEDNIKYRAAVYAGMQTSYGTTFFGGIELAVRDTLYENLSDDTAAVCFAMLTGNTRQIQENTIESFRNGGVAHIFAVSGLHIGIIFAIISFLCKKLRMNKYVTAALSLGLVFFYCGICGFTLSSLRAAIMCAVGAVATLTYQKYDGLNALAVAVIIILSFTPLSLFSVGFKLSVCAVGGIFILLKSIMKALSKLKIPKRAGSAVGVSLGAQAGTMPVMLAEFGYISGAGMLLNILFVPLLSAIFAVLLGATFLSLIIPVAAPFILPYAALPLEFLISFFVGAGFENSLISGFGAGLFPLIFFIAILALNDKFNLKILTRVIALICSVSILAGYVVIQQNSPFGGYTVTISAYYSGGEVLVRSQNGKVLIVTAEANVSRLDNLLNRYYSNDIDALIIVGNEAAAYYANIGVRCNDVYVCDVFPHVQPYGDFQLKYAEEFSVCGINCRFYDENTLLADIGGVEFGICASDNFTLNSCDIFIADTENRFCDCGVEIFFNNRLGPLNVFDCGDITYEISKGVYCLKNTIPSRS